jgi:hypothetical protein
MLQRALVPLILTILVTPPSSYGLEPISTSPHQHAEVFTGPTQIWTTPEGALLVSVQGVADEMDHVFTLQQGKDWTMVQEEFPSARVLFKGDLLEVRPTDRDVTWVFEIEMPDRLSPERLSSAERVVVRGYGLSHHQQPRRPGSDLRAAVASFFQRSDGSGDSGGSGCDSGGPGSTQCSVGCGGDGEFCSVTCGSGYACCRCSTSGPRCSCKSGRGSHFSTGYFRPGASGAPSCHILRSHGARDHGSTVEALW